MLSPKIKSKIDSLWDKLWSGGIANPMTAMEQISYLLFMRRIDEEDRKKIKNSEWSGEPYESLFVGEYHLPNSDQKVAKTDLRWSNFTHLEGGQMLAHIQNKVFPFLKEINGKASVFATNMKDSVFIMPKASLLVEAVTIIEDIYKEISKEIDNGQAFQDTQGDMYEYLLNEIASAGKNGQFRTPRHIIQMICELVDPQIGNKICDPACGTGGFLLGAYQHILNKYTSDEHKNLDVNGLLRGTIGDKIAEEKVWTSLKKDTLFGYDFDTTMVRVGLMNLILHGITDPQIKYMDTLSKKFVQTSMYDVVLANPPFKGSIDKGDINEDLSLKTTKTELLFVNRIINLLRIGGKAGVIIPNGVLSTANNAFIDLRKLLVDTCELQAVISLPSGVFKPYAGVATAVLIFVKGGTTEKTWFYNMANDGFSLDDKRNKIEQNDIPNIIETFKKKEVTDKSFVVSKKEIVDNDYSLLPSTYKPAVYEAIHFEFTPKEYLQQLEDIENKILLNIKDLKKMVGM